VQPGTFAILKPWEEAQNWGKGAILSYKIDYNSLECTAWIPNTEIPGTFFKSYWSQSVDWAGVILPRISFDPKTGEFSAIPDTINANLYLLSSFVGYMILIVLWVALIGYNPFRVVFKPSLL